MKWEKKRFSTVSWQCSVSVVWIREKVQLQGKKFGIKGKKNKIKKKKEQSQQWGLSTMSINCWNVAGTPWSPKRRTSIASVLSGCWRPSLVMFLWIGPPVSTSWLGPEWRWTEPSLGTLWGHPLMAKGSCRTLLPHSASGSHCRAGGYRLAWVWRQWCWTRDWCNNTTCRW